MPYMTKFVCASPASYAPFEITAPAVTLPAEVAWFKKDPQNDHTKNRPRPRRTARQHQRPQTRLLLPQIQGPRTLRLSAKPKDIIEEEEMGVLEVAK